MTYSVDPTQSILLSIRKMMIGDANDSSFDHDLIMHINTVLMILNQLGVGPKGGFVISDEYALWSSFVDANKLPMVKTYVYAKVRSLFDPPTIGSVSQALNAQIAEMEWRLNVAVDPGEEDE